MTPLQTLEALRQLGAGLRIDDGGQLIVTAPRGVIGADLAAAIRANKPDLVKMLADPIAEVCAVYDAWQADPQPDNTAWARRYAQAAIAAGLPFYTDDTTDLGADGWQRVTIDAADYGDCMTANGLTAIRSEWPENSPNPIVYAARASGATTTSDGAKC